MPSYDRALELTTRFYEWERWGRGWITADIPVALEPPLFFPDWYARARPRVDDTRKPHWLKRLLGHPNGEVAESEEWPAFEAEPERFLWDTLPEEFLVYVPRGSRLPRSISVGWLQGLTVLSAPLSFEIVGDGGEVALRLACAAKDAGLVATTLRGVAPPVALLPTEPLYTLWRERTPDDQAETRHVAGLEFGLAREFVVPLPGMATRGLDPLSALAAPLAALERGEVAVLQVLFVPVAAPWAEAIQRAVTTPGGEPFFADVPTMTKLAFNKITSPLFAVALRAVVSTERPERSYEVLRSITGSLARFGSPTQNEFVPLATEDAGDLVLDVMRRETHRPGMILSGAELAGIVTLPEEPERVPGLVIPPSGKRAPEETLTSSKSGVVLGENEVGGGRFPVRLSDEARLRHTHVVGASGTGKSNLLVSLILQDIEAGRGVAVLDPHGDLVDDVLARLPEGRIPDAVLFDPSDPEAVVGWNVLAAESEAERQLLASDLVAVFRRLSTSWGDQMTAVLANAILAFLDSPRGGTLQDSRRRRSASRPRLPARGDAPSPLRGRGSPTCSTPRAGGRSSTSGASSWSPAFARSTCGA